ncbi:MAG: UDP-N-acetylmuramoyl-L-alanine--D-glutamate ligase [Candidatus Nanopelagicales bacterium]|nr:UDP-N-acetylmuramoyl-L-alanine--D-glutamate ligase [Actinomycetota bacterium]
MTALPEPGQQSWRGLRVVVAGLGIAGFACADALLQREADVVVIDDNDGPEQVNKAQILEVLGATVLLGDASVLPDADLLVVSPGLPPSASVTQAALAAGMPVWGELELAWRIRDPDGAPWLFVTGTNGKTTTTLMLASMFRAAGLRTDAVGNIGVSLVSAVMDPEPFDVLAVEVGAPQLPFVHTVSPYSAACLNVAEDHVDFFGSFDAYREAKARVYERTQVACVYNSQDPETIRMVEQAEVIEGCRAIGFTLGVPGRSEVGLVDEILADRAFLDERETHALELATLADVRPPVPHQVANALAAAALARSYGIDPRHVRDGLRGFEPAGHRIAEVGTVADVLYIDDSKATNTHAADMSLRAYDPVVWIAGGLAKGQTFDDLVERHAGRLRAVVLLGADRGVILEALRRHAPDVPVEEVTDTETGAMHEVVNRAAALARPGDTVLLAPGCASWDMFTDYAARGRAFAAAVADLEA